MAYVIEYQRVAKTTSGHLRAVATIWAPSDRESTATNGDGVVRTELHDVTRITGYKDDVWDVVQRMQAAGAMVQDKHPALKAMPRGGIATIDAVTLTVDVLHHDVPAKLSPHEIISKVHAWNAAKAAGRSIR